MPSRTQAVLLLIAAALLWSLGGVLIKLVDWTPLGIAGARSAIAAGVVLLLMRRRPDFTWSRAQLGAALGYAGTVILFVAANRLTTAANAILLQYTAPMYAALLAPLFLKEPTRRLDWFFIFLLLGGMGLFFLDRVSSQGLWGMFCAIGSGFCFAVMVLCLRGQRGRSNLESMVLGNLLAALICLPFAGGLPPRALDWLWLGLLGVVQLGLPYYLYALAVKRVSAVEALLIPMMEPIVNPLLALFVLGEIPGPWSLAGGVLVLGGAAVRAWIAARSNVWLK